MNFNAIFNTPQQLSLQKFQDMKRFALFIKPSGTPLICSISSNDYIDYIDSGYVVTVFGNKRELQDIADEMLCELSNND